jgi:hypothetical protein
VDYLASLFDTSDLLWPSPRGLLSSCAGKAASTSLVVWLIASCGVATAADKTGRRSEPTRWQTTLGSDIRIKPSSVDEAPSHRTLSHLDHDAVLGALGEVGLRDGALAEALRPMVEDFQCASRPRLIRDARRGGESPR